jgi:hypothetical protein
MSSIIWLFQLGPMVPLNQHMIKRKNLPKERKTLTAPFKKEESLALKPLVQHIFSKSCFLNVCLRLSNCIHSWLFLFYRAMDPKGGEYTEFHNECLMRLVFAVLSWHISCSLSIQAGRKAIWTTLAASIN